MHVAASRAGIYIMQLGAVSPHTRYRFPVERVRWKHIRAPPPGSRRVGAMYATAGDARDPDAPPIRSNTTSVKESSG